MATEEKMDVQERFKYLRMIKGPDRRDPNYMMRF